MSIYRPYTSNGGVPGNSAGGVKPQPYPQTSLLGAFVSRLPYAYQIISTMIENNPKFYEFKNQASLRDDMLQDQSVFLAQQPSQDNYTMNSPGGLSINKDYQAFVYASLDKDKVRRLMDYRRMAAYAEMADCLDEICDECIVVNENEEVVQYKTVGNYSKNIQDTLKKEFSNFVQIFDLENTGWERFRQLLVDGEIFFENLIKEDKKHLGIIGTMMIPSDLVNPVYHNVQNELIKGYLLRKPIMGPTQSLNTEDQEELMFLQKAQVTYINSGIWNEFKTMRLPFIENSKRAYRQLSLIEDSVVIYRLVRAPERFLFKVDVGNMPQPKVDSYMRGLMMKYWSKKTFSGVDGKVTNVYDPQSMLDAFWLPRDAQGKGVDVSTLPSGGALGEIKDLDYFLTKLYKTLKVPASRFMNAGDVFKDGTEITRDELRFARFIIRLQSQFAAGIKQSFITHLKLKGLWEKYNLKEQAVKVKFNEPSSFMAMRNQQLMQLKFDNYNTATQGDGISKSYAQKYYLSMSSEQMKENREWQRRDAALKWELDQISQSGPNFRELLAAQQPGAGGEGEMGGMPPDLGGGGGGAPPGSEAIPEFGGGGGEASGESPAPEAGGAGAPSDLAAVGAPPEAPTAIEAPTT